MRFTAALCIYFSKDCRCRVETSAWWSWGAAGGNRAQPEVRVGPGAGVEAVAVGVEKSGPTGKAGGVAGARRGRWQSLGPGGARLAHERPGATGFLAHG